MDAPKPTLVTVTGDVEKYNEYYNLGEYYMKLFYTNNGELTIICYNMQVLDGTKYEVKLNLEKIYDLSNVFRQYTNMKELYEFIIDLINEGKYELKKKDNNMILNIMITDIKKNEHNITFTLYNENNNNTQ